MERYKNSTECISAVKEIFNTEQRTGTFNYLDITTVVLSILRTMESNSATSRQLHDGLTRHMNDFTPARVMFQRFFGLALIFSMGRENDIEFVVKTYRDNGVVGSQNSQLTESELISFIENAKTIHLTKK